MDEPEYMSLAPHDRHLVMTEALRQVASLEHAGGRPLPVPDRARYVAELRRQFATDPDVLSFLRRANEQRQLAHFGNGTSRCRAAGGDELVRFADTSEPPFPRRLMPPRPDMMRFMDEKLAAIQRHMKKRLG